jgi:thymidylate synthase (FAD)
MKIINASVEILTPINGEEILKHIEKIGRVCYKSETNITPDSSRKFVANLIKNKHDAMIEHFNISVKFICDRGVTHELVRHRIASYAQESTRYCNYNKDKFGNEITVIEPLFFNEESQKYALWKSACEYAEDSYFKLLFEGATPQEARSVLPNSLKTEIVVTMNLRELRHFFRLRTAKAAHPQMREVAIMLLNKLKIKIPVIFDDIEVE